MVPASTEARYRVFKRNVFIGDIVAVNGRPVNSFTELGQQQTGQGGQAVGELARHRNYRGNSAPRMSAICLRSAGRSSVIVFQMIVQSSPK